MRDYSLTHLRDEVLLRDLGDLIAQERGTMASVLAHLAEVDARKRFLPLGYSSMFAYCREELHLSEDTTTEQVEKRRFGTAARPRRRRTGARTRYIPALVRHAVWNRDEGRCTFVGANGHRCNSGTFLEFDHVDPRHRQDTVSGLRLRCRAHNQYEAERVFGSEFMARKREEARHAAEGKRADAEARSQATAEDAEVEDQIQDVLSALRGLGIKGEQARRAAAHARTLQHASLADRIRAALQYHGESIMRSPKAARALYASG